MITQQTCVVYALALLNFCERGFTLVFEEKQNLTADRMP
jgi:hypothetical protein